MRIVLTLLIMVLVSPVNAGELMQDLFGCTSDDYCVITYNGGGNIRSFEIAASEARAHGTRVTIRGRCESACVIFASTVRDLVCLSSRARMRVHMGTKMRVHDSDGVELDEHVSLALSYDLPAGFTIRWSAYVPDYGADINEWARTGKKLHPNPAVFTTMTRREALRFWKPCA